jgi:lipoprotein-releasing system permease protein
LLKSEVQNLKFKAKGLAIMYKLLLAWRYLCTRYIALASILSVTLGVMTLIVVNSVMSGFTHEMHIRLKSILSDIVVESHGLDGFPDAQWHMQEIRNVLGNDVQGITATVHVPAMLSYQVRGHGQWLTRQVTLIGVDAETYAQVGDFKQYLIHPENRARFDFALRENGYADADHAVPPAGWEYRRSQAALTKAYQEQLRQSEHLDENPAASPPADPFAAASPPADPFAKGAPEVQPAVFDSAKEQHTGIVLGIAMCSVRQRDKDGKVRDHYLARPGDDVRITVPTSGAEPKPASDYFTIVDFYESKMSEYDSNFAIVPLETLQNLRLMVDPATQVRSVSSIQIKLKEGVDLNAAKDKLLARFPPDAWPFRIQTWRDMQGPLLAAVQMETTLLNILLFLIIAVAGFGILATFFMIVVEKTKDIGILKALGASTGGVRSIFLTYGLSLGLVGSGAGMVAGLLFVAKINQIAKLIEIATGHEVFDPTIYYFSQIPTIVEPLTVLGVVAGAVAIAVLASVLPAQRAARLHPVEALRYE